MNETETNPDIVFADWKSPPVPPIVLAPEVAASAMGRTVGEAASWPEPDAVWTARVPIVLVKDDSETAVTWIRRVIREELVPQDLADRLIAARQVFGGEDAFLVAWTVDERPLRVAVTRERLHVLSLLEGEPQAADEPQARTARMPMQAIAFANTVLRLPEPLTAEHMQARMFGGAILCTLPLADVPAWHETLILLVQDRTVKASVLRELGGGSPPKGEGPRGDPVPWFPVP